MKISNDSEVSVEFHSPEVVDGWVEYYSFSLSGGAMNLRTSCTPLLTSKGMGVRKYELIFLQQVHILVLATKQHI